MAPVRARHVALARGPQWPYLLAMSNDAEALPLREAGADDVGPLVDLINASYRGEAGSLGWTHEADLLRGKRVDAERMRATVLESSNVVLLHEEGAVVVACVLLERTADGAHLGMLTVSPVHQAHGLGRRMLAAAEHYIRTRWQGSAVHMTVIAQREELIAWYERRGYARTGEQRPFPYGNARSGEPLREDLAFVVLRKDLSRD